MNKTLVSVLLGLLFLFTSCQSAEQVISNSVKELNNVCPYELDSKEGKIEKVEYKDHSIIFYVVLNENTLMTDSLPYSEIKRIENDPNVNKQVISQCLSGLYVFGAFKGITQAMAEEVDLSFIVICKEEKSKEELTFKISWRDVVTISKYVLRK
jgi:hypothetical protein